jgi:hypothetical protein
MGSVGTSWDREFVTVTNIIESLRVKARHETRSAYDKNSVLSRVQRHSDFT